MGTSGIVTLMVVMTIAVAGFAIWSHRKRVAIWRAVSEELGLQLQADKLVEGRYKGFSVRAEEYTVTKGKSSTTYTQVDIQGKWPSDIQIGRESFVSSLLTMDWEDWEVGDPSFDKRAKMSGPPQHLMALLSYENRGLLAHALSQGWSIVGDELQFLTTNRQSQPQNTIVFGVELAKALSEPFRKLKKSLFIRATEDPLESVKEAALAILHANYPESSESKKANVVALLSPNPRIRSTAAAYLGKYDMLAKVAANDEEESASRVHALRLYALHEGQEGLDELSQHLMGSYETLDATVQEAYLSFLGAYPRSPHEDFLLSRLDLEKGGLRLAVMESLGKIGSITKSVPKLLEIRDRSALPLSKERSHAKEAILAIQARSGHIQEGQLSMVDTSSAGGLDIVEP